MTGIDYLLSQYNKVIAVLSFSQTAFDEVTFWIDLHSAEFTVVT